MSLNRREGMKLAIAAGVTAAAGAAQAETADLTKDNIPPRVPLDEFVKDQALMDAFRRGVREMKRRKPSDPLSWWYQAAIHGTTIEMIRIEAVNDPNMIAVDQKKYWNQCPHFGQASANFLPWHRAYTHHFERILRAHTGEPRFSLPYWDYHRAENYYFPRDWGIRQLPQPLDGDRANPLYHDQRNIYFTDWQHWSDPNYKPYSQLTPEAVDWSRARDAMEFFGETEREGLGGGLRDEDISTRGLLESFPHDPIHRLVGGFIFLPPLPNPNDPQNPIPQEPAAGGMATPPTAGFDPIFCVHHANMDRLWAEWSLMPGKRWGKMPPNAWLDDTPWFFWDVEMKDGKLSPVAVNRPRRDYFSYRALGISFKGEDLNKTPLELPSASAGGGAIVPLAPLPPPVPIGDVMAPSLVRGGLPTRISLAPAAARLRTGMAGAGQVVGGAKTRVLMRISGIDLGTVNATGFEVHLVRSAEVLPKRGDASFIGTIALFRHDGHAPGSGHHHGAGATPKGVDTFDITKILQAAGQPDPAAMYVVIVPYSLSASTDGKREIVELSPLTLERIEFLTQAA